MSASFRSREDRDRTDGKVRGNGVVDTETSETIKEQIAALENEMRVERNRRLQRSGRPKKSTSALGETKESREKREKGGSSSLHYTVSSTRQPLPSEAQSLQGYKKELDEVNGGNGVFRLHHYTSDHLNPSDVNFYPATSVVRRYLQQSSLKEAPPTRNINHLDQSSRPLPRRDDPSGVGGNQSTLNRSARLRLQKTRQILNATNSSREHAKGTLRAASRGPRTAPPPQPVKEPQPPPRHSSEPNAAVAGAVATVPREISRPGNRLAGGTSTLSDRSWLTEPRSVPSTWPDNSLNSRVYTPFSLTNDWPREMASRVHPKSVSPFKPIIAYGAAGQRDYGNPSQSSSYLIDTIGRRDHNDSVISQRQSYQPIVATTSNMCSTSSSLQTTRWAGLSAGTPGDKVSTQVSKMNFEVSPLSPQSPYYTGERYGSGARSAITSDRTEEPNLLDGFQMPHASINRSDLFQGHSAPSPENGKSQK